MNVRDGPMEDSEPNRWKTLITNVLDTALLPIRPLVSESAQKAYLGTALFTATSFLLLSLATVAFWLFYYEYVPQPGVERVVHLQFGNGHPHGTSTFQDALVADQSYDISLILNLPRTPSNLQTGNFMLSLSLLPLNSNEPLSQSLLPSALLSDNKMIAHARRPAILTYTSPLTSMANTLAYMPLYFFGLSSESESLTVPMFEGVHFSKGASNIPNAANIIIEADEKMQFYSVTLRIIAKLSGLRWILYNHRILSFFVFTAAFWSSSMISMTVVWLALSIYMSSAEEVKEQDNGNTAAIKHEDVADDDSEDLDLSDTSRTFPTLGRQRPLKYEAPTIKEEDDSVLDTPLQPLQAMSMEADDEDEFEDAAASTSFRDSGIGTGREETVEGLQRRRKRGSGEPAVR